MCQVGIKLKLFLQFITISIYFKCLLFFVCIGTHLINVKLLFCICIYILRNLYKNMAMQNKILICAL